MPSDAGKLTTMQVSVDLNDRIKHLASKYSRRIGLSEPLSQKRYLEILVTEEEKRETKNKKNQGN
jgi:predicted transcriptional regulator